MGAGKGLRILRKESGKSISKVAGLAGVSAGNLCDIENEKQSPYIYTVINIARAIGMDLHRLAHYSFDLDPPESMYELDGTMRHIVDLVRSLDEVQQRELVGYIRRMLDEGGEFKETAWSPEGEYG